jgi:hypothetical protein
LKRGTEVDSDDCAPISLEKRELSEKATIISIRRVQLPEANSSLASVKRQQQVACQGTALDEANLFRPE